MVTKGISVNDYGSDFEFSLTTKKSVVSFTLHQFIS